MEISFQEFKSVCNHKLGLGFCGHPRAEQGTFSCREHKCPYVKAAALDTIEAGRTDKQLAKVDNT